VQKARGLEPSGGVKLVSIDVFAAIHAIRINPVADRVSPRPPRESNLLAGDL
jgi:hypothetical protein